MNDFTLEKFTELDKADGTSAYIEALEAFDSIPQLQELKHLANVHCGLKPKVNVLDVGCGFGLETLRLAKLAPEGVVAGVDLSQDFIDIAQRRAKNESLDIEFRQASALDLPYPDNHFDVVRAERILIYLDDVEGALREAKRVLKPGGRIALIEPEFSSTTINLPNRSLVRKVMAHEVDTAVVQSWLPGQLQTMLPQLGFSNTGLASRVLVFPQELAQSYFENVGRHAAENGAIEATELNEWLAGIKLLSETGSLFGNIGYFLFIAQG